MKGNSLKLLVHTVTDRATNRPSEKFSVSIHHIVVELNIVVIIAVVIVVIYCSNSWFNYLFMNEMLFEAAKDVALKRPEKGNFKVMLSLL